MNIGTEYKTRESNAEVLDFEVFVVTHFTNGSQHTDKFAVRYVRAITDFMSCERSVSHITIGSTRNHVTITKAGVASVIYYDCFYLEPEEPDLVLEKKAYDYICDEYQSEAIVCAQDYDEYISLVNRGAFKQSLDDCINRATTISTSSSCGVPPLKSQLVKETAL